jgi:signal transduction histidine kinase
LKIGVRSIRERASAGERFRPLQRMRTNSPSEIDQLKAERARLGQALLLAERDRQLLGYEIHDDVVQSLTAAAMRLEGAGRQATFASRDDKESYATGLRLLQECIASARRLIRGVVSVEVDQRGFRAALASLVDKFRADYALPVTLACDIDVPQLPDTAQYLLLRIAQEALHNAWKHAQATSIELRLAICDDKLELSIADNGVGFEPADLSAGHFGLEGIRTRARILAANLLFDTAPNHGTRIVVQLTIPPAV